MILLAALLAVPLGGAASAARAQTEARAPSDAHERVGAERVVTTSDGVRLAVTVAGAGPPVLFVHGGPGQGSRSFAQMGGAALEPFATMIYLDQRGSGRSDSAGDYHLERLVRDLDEVRARLGYDRVYLLAHSFGGVLAVNYAARHPEHVAGLILTGATVHFLDDGLLAEKIAFAHRLLGRRERVDPALPRDTLLARYAAARAALGEAGLGYRFLTDSVATIQTMNRIDGGYPRATQFGNAVMQHPEAYPEYYRDYAPLTRTIRAPVLVVAGTRDHAIGPQHHRTFRFPHQRVVRVDGGHLLYYDATGAFAAAVRDFLRAHAYATRMR